MQKSSPEPSRYRPLRRTLGWLRLVAWVLSLWALARPWGDLGGLVDERLRWLARSVPWIGVLAGVTVGGFARDACGYGGRWTHARWSRWLLWPVLGATAALAIAFEAADAEDVASVAILAALAWCAGLDSALAGWPLACGRDYRFAGPVDLFEEMGDLADLDDFEPDED